MKSRDQLLLEQAYETVREGFLDKAKAFVNKNIVQYDRNAPGGSNAPGGKEYEANAAKQRQADADKQQEEQKAAAAAAEQSKVASLMKQTPEDVKAAAPYSAYVEKAINHMLEKSQYQNNPNVRDRNTGVPDPNKSTQSLESFIYNVKEDTARFGPQNLDELLFDLGDGVRKFNPNKPLVKALVAQYNKVFKSGSDRPHSDQQPYQPAAGGARTSRYNTVQPGMGKR